MCISFYRRITAISTRPRAHHHRLDETDPAGFGKGSEVPPAQFGDQSVPMSCVPILNQQERTLRRPRKGSHWRKALQMSPVPVPSDTKEQRYHSYGCTSTVSQSDIASVFGRRFANGSCTVGIVIASLQPGRGSPTPMQH